MATKLFEDRKRAGRALGERLAAAGLGDRILVLGVPRGGVPVACEVGAALGVPVSALVVRKLGAPFNSELAVGAIAFGGVTVYNEDVLAEFGLREEDIEPVRVREQAELERRERAYGLTEPPDVAGRIVVVVDDGMATGATMNAAVLAVRALGPRRVIAAVPTGAVDAVERLARVADEVVALAMPEPYYGVGAWYGEFPQLTDREVIECLGAAASRPGLAEQSRRAFHAGR